MGNSQSIKKIGFEDMQIVIKNPEIYLLINTLPNSEQGCLIINTINIEQEEAIINKYMHENKSIRIVIYGKNSNDELVNKKRVLDLQIEPTATGLFLIKLEKKKLTLRNSYIEYKKSITIIYY